MIQFSIRGSLPRINSDLSEVMREVSQLLKDSVIQNFDEGGRPRWQPLKYDGLFKTPLIMSHRLYSSVKSSSDSNSATVTAGEGLGIYPFVQQFGSTHTVPVTPRSVAYFWWMFNSTGEEGWKRMAIAGNKNKFFQVKIPARPYMMFQEEDITKVMELVGSGLVTFSQTEPADRND